MKNILITGASSGLGLFLTRYFNNINYDLTTIGKDKIKLKKLKLTLKKKKC